ncbi:alpha/beta fold hydrolase [Sorangium sp. So ce260]|uniref:alpha/beta fold hydrolase n=1 Tax=Sorangium sp. So ce260 TaxID=3133291 RepID=UPI003F638655
MTAPLRLLLLPGLDGTGALFAPFLEALSAESTGVAPEVVSYPADRALDYGALEDLVAARLPAGGPYALLGESFSGPLALRLACRRPGGLVGVILVATFVTNPVWLVPSLARHLVGPWLFRRRAPELVSRRYLVGAGASAEWLERVAANVETVDPAVMAARVREVLSVDARGLLQRCAAPLLYLGAAGDALVPPRVVRELRRLRPDLECVTVDAPHLVLQLAPEASARAIEGFLRRAAARPGSAAPGCPGDP